MSLVVLQLSYVRITVLIVMFVNACVDMIPQLAIVTSGLFTATSCSHTAAQAEPYAGSVTLPNGIVQARIILLQHFIHNLELIEAHQAG